MPYVGEVMSFGLKIGNQWFDPTKVRIKGVKRVSDLPGAPETLTVLRVVHKGHETYTEASQGICRPWGAIPPKVTIENQLALTAGTRPGTGLTCWSTDPDYSMRLAQPGDVIMMARVDATEAYIPANAYDGESEVHLHGGIRAARVVHKR